MLHSQLKIQGTFWILGGISISGFFFILFVGRETRGLSTKAKKDLYSSIGVVKSEAKKEKEIIDD